MGDWDNMLAGVLAGASSLSQGINAGLNRLQQTELMRMAEEARKAAFAAKVAETKRQEELVRNKESLSLAANIYPGAQPQPAPRPTPNLTPPLSVRLPAVFGSTSEFSGFKPSSEFTLKPRMDFALNPSMDFALKPLMNFESAAKNAVSHFGGSNLNPVESILPQPPRDLDLENITRLGIDALRRESLTGVPSSEEADALAQKQSEALDVFEKTGNTSALRAVQARIAAHNQAAKDRKASQSAENTTRALMALADWRRQNPNAFDDESKPVVAQIAQYYGVDPKTLPVFDASGRLKALADINAKNAQAAEHRANAKKTEAEAKARKTPAGWMRLERDAYDTAEDLAAATALEFNMPVTNELLKYATGLYNEAQRDREKINAERATLQWKSDIAAQAAQGKTAQAIITAAINRTYNFNPNSLPQMIATVDALTGNDKNVIMEALSDVAKGQNIATIRADLAKAKINQAVINEIFPIRK